MARLIIVCGMTGSGKSTIARRVAASGAIRLCPDEWMRSAGVDLWDTESRALVESQQWTLAQALLLRGTDVVIEWGTWAREERDVLRDWCRAHDVQVSLVHVDVDVDEIRRRLSLRNRLPGETHIPIELIDEWIAGPWQPPTADEIALFDPFELPPPRFISRPWQVDDIPFLWDVLYLSIHVREGWDPPSRDILDDHALAHYLRDFGRLDGDDAQVATDEFGTRLAAAFCRRTTAEDPGWGHVSPDIPELGMAVVESQRGQGIGRRVLSDLLERHPVMSLSVDLENPVARGLYESLGFEWVADEGTAATMLRGLRPT